jgi:hypothetical protein
MTATTKVLKDIKEQVAGPQVQGKDDRMVCPAFRPPRIQAFRPGNSLKAFNVHGLQAGQPKSMIQQ